MPPHLRKFDPGDWPEVPEPEWCATDSADKRASFRLAGKRRAWSDAGKAWCAANGGDWYGLTR